MFSVNRLILLVLGPHLTVFGQNSGENSRKPRKCLAHPAKQSTQNCSQKRARKSDFALCAPEIPTLMSGPKQIEWLAHEWVRNLNHNQINITKSYLYVYRESGAQRAKTKSYPNLRKKFPLVRHIFVPEFAQAAFLFLSPKPNSRPPGFGPQS